IYKKKWKRRGKSYCSKDDKMKTLIIGGSGFLGSKLIGSLNGSSQSTYHQNRIFLDQIQMDLADKASIRNCLAETKPDVVLHCGGLTNTDFCEANQDLANRVNCLGTEALLKEFDGKIVYFSTDYVFDGEHAPYDEKSEPNPLNHYGKTNRFLDKLRRAKVIAASQELISTPTYIENIAKAVPEFMDMSGILHFTGQQPFSRYDFAKLAAESLGLDSEVVAQKRDGIARKPRNSSLVS